MSYHFENVRLEKGMYGRSGTSFTRTLEELGAELHRTDREGTVTVRVKDGRVGIH